jgi:hypothetical protein
MSQQGGVPVTVTIVGGNAVVGQALELLLEGLGYRAHYEGKLDPAGPTRWLAGTQLIVLAPGLSVPLRDAVLTGNWHDGADGCVPVLELSGDDHPPGSARHVRWPCRAEELAHAIDAALGSGRCRAGAEN